MLLTLFLLPSPLSKNKYIKSLLTILSINKYMKLSPIQVVWEGVGRSHAAILGHRLTEPAVFGVWLPRSQLVSSQQKEKEEDHG